MKRSSRRSKTQPSVASPQATRRRRSATVAVRRGTTLLQSGAPRRMEPRLAPPRQAERQHARPGAGIKRARAVMRPKKSR
jgi:hypothetical protein